METNILASLEAAKQDLINVINSFDATQFSTVPFEGSWTAGQVTDHIVKAAAGLPQTLTGNTEKTERDPNEKIGMIAGIFLDMEKKFQSPDFIIPSNPPHEIPVMAEKVQQAFDNIINTAKQTDLTATCLAFELPGMGTLTGNEWLHFILYHTQRHTTQMRNVMKAL